jgi:quercetin dioxygenase-like cupin family protein
MRRKILAISGAVALAFCGLAGGAAADTVTSKAAPVAPITENAVLGTLDGPAVAIQSGVSLAADRDVTVRTATLTYPTNSESGWHSHPGLVIAVVKQGAVVRKVGCTSVTFRAGQSFTEVEPHFVKNLYTKPTQAGAVPAILEITQIFPVGATPREPQVTPTCPRS